jgi:hypothetical protein
MKSQHGNGYAEIRQCLDAENDSSLPSINRLEVVLPIAALSIVQLENGSQSIILFGCEGKGKHATTPKRLR